MGVLSMGTQEEQGQRAGAGVGADHRAHVADDHFLYPALLLQLLSKIFCVLLAVAVGDKHGAVVVAFPQLLGLAYQRVNGGSAAPGLGHADEMALIVHVEHRLDLQHGADQSGGGADPPAPL